MGSATSVPGVPPAGLPALPPQWAFLNEYDVWPILHVLVPFSTYVQYRSFWLTMGLVVFAEWLEALVFAIWPDASINGQTLTETVQDAILSDLTAAFIAIVCAELFLRAIRWNYRFTFWCEFKNRAGKTRLLFHWGLFFKYALQLILISAAFGGAFFYFGDPALFSIGLCIVPVWAPFWMWVASKWNVKDTLVIVDAAFFPPDLVYYGKESTFKRKTILFKDIPHRLYLWWAIFVALFSAASIYKWTSYFLMAIGYMFIAILILGFILMVRYHKRHEKRHSAVERLLYE